MNLYNYFKQLCLDTGNVDAVDMNTDDIRLLYLNGYTFDATDQYVADVLAGPETEIGRTDALGSPTVVNGTFDAADETTSGIAGGSTITDVVMFKHTGNDATAVVIAHIDEDQAAVPLSLATDGSPITAAFHASGIFDL